MNATQEFIKTLFNGNEEAFIEHFVKSCLFIEKKEVEKRAEEMLTDISNNAKINIRFGKKYLDKFEAKLKKKFKYLQKKLLNLKLLFMVRQNKLLSLLLKKRQVTLLMVIIVISLIIPFLTYGLTLHIILTILVHYGI